MAVEEMIARIDENVKNLVKYREEDRQAFAAHTAKDEKTNAEFLLPLWNESQQRKGAGKLAALLYTTIGGAFVALTDFIIKGNHP